MTLTAARLRLYFSWVVTGIVVSACSARGTSPGEQTTNALLIAGISGIAIIFLVVVARWVVNRNWTPPKKGGAIGLAFGLILAAVIIRRVPLETQLLFIGVALGVGSDWLATLKQPGGPKTSINYLAGMIVGTAKAILGAAEQSGIEGPEYAVVTSGLWAMVGAIAFTLIIGNLF